MTYTPNKPVKELQLHRPRLSAWLEIAGEPVSLLDPRLNKDTNTVCTCVEASPDQEYAIAYRLEMDRPEEADVCVDVTVDGKALPGLWLPRGHAFWATPSDSQDRIVRIGARGAKNGLAFAQLPEDGSPSGGAGKKPVNTKLGTIQLDVHYVHYVHAAEAQSNASSPKDDGNSSAHEASAEPSTSSPTRPAKAEIEVTSTRIVGFSFYYRSRATLLRTGILPSAATASTPAPINPHATPIRALPARFAALNRTPWSAASSPLSQCDSLWGTPQLNNGSAPGSPYTPATPMEEWVPVKGGANGREMPSSPVRPGDEERREVMLGAGGKRRASEVQEGGESVGAKRARSEEA